MIQPITMYKCVCDNCGETITFGEGWTVFDNEDLDDWMNHEEYSMQVINDKHICYDCITHDDEGETIIDQKRTKI